MVQKKIETMRRYIFWTIGSDLNKRIFLNNLLKNTIHLVDVGILMHGLRVGFTFSLLSTEIRSQE